MKKSILITALIMVFVSLQANAGRSSRESSNRHSGGHRGDVVSDIPDSHLELGEPEYAGTGCPNGTVASVLSPDNTALSVLFDQYVAEAGESNGKTMDRKNCSLGIPIKVPGGYSVSVIKVDYRGYTFIPRGARVRFDVEYFFAGSRGPAIREVMTGPKDDNYVLTDRLLASALVWSACGADTNIRINTSLLAQTNRNRDDVLATLDSTDVDTKVIYHLAWRRCR
jgi:Domain of unknown function (DUF4360)